jgi:toxin CcdB
MARPAGRQFAFYRMPKGGRGYLVDVQADRLSHLRFRVVVPLLPVEIRPPELPRLNPRIEIMGEWFIFAPNAIATVPVSDLGKQVGDLSEFQDAFHIALEVLLKGFP